MYYIDTFEDFKKELKRQFYLDNAEEETSVRLRRLKQSRNVREHIKEFTSSALEILDIATKIRSSSLWLGFKDRQRRSSNVTGCEILYQ